MNAIKPWRHVIFSTLACVVSAHAEVSVPTIFTSHMVLQQGVNCPVWGTASAGEAVTVSFAGQTVQVKADNAGNWSARLKPLAASAKPQVMTIKGENTITLEDVLVGEVWLCSGQPRNRSCPLAHLTESLGCGHVAIRSPVEFRSPCG
jgi:sialate O-acetylesterase